MGHIASSPVYRRLQKRLERNIEGAPPRQELFDILRILFSEEEADLAAKMPMRPMNIKDISRRTGVPAARLRGILDHMADRGLVLDMFLEGKQESFYLLAPPIIGFFEFSMMRVRSDIPQKELARLMEGYLSHGDEFARTFFSGETQCLRALVHETALTPEQSVEIMDYEKATEVVGGAATHAVSLCYCRHKMQHLDTPCKFPLENCMSLGSGADTLARHGLARLISRSEALEIMARSRELGLVQSADNVRDGVSFICNCCGCCCGMMTAVNTKGIEHSVMTSNYIARVSRAACRGCGACVKRCPVRALTIEGKAEGCAGWAVVDERICLGCGVCVGACKFESLGMERRAARVLTPENVMDRVLLMAVERGKLQNLLFDNWDDPGQEWVRRALGAVLNLPAAKKLLASEQLRSRFVKEASARAGM